MTQSPEPIAVIGMACRLPGAPDLERFWFNLVSGTESIAFPDAETLTAAGVSEAELAHPDYVRAVPLMPDADRFDAALFGMTATEAEVCDPQIRVFLETSHAALENAGYDPFAVPGRVGVYGTTSPNSYLRHVVANRPELVDGTPGMVLFTLNNADYLATLVSHKLDLRGPSMTVLTACSSSLVAVHVAAQALQAGDCDVAVAGGSTIELPLGHGHLWTPGGVLTEDGHCRPFDAAASGTIFGSGAGAVILKRLGDALADGDRIAAVIRATAVNNDGADKVSFSAPSVTGQAAAVAAALRRADVAPSSIDYVEAHATGTDLGDPIEIAALTEAYAAASATPLRPGRTAIGSVKSNIGHMNPVAGVAGLIKTALMLDRQTMVPSINITEPNPKLELDRTPFEVVTEVRPWPRREDRPRLAAVNSLGIGGTNAHAVLAEGPVPPRLPEDGRPRIVVWSARDDAGRQRLGLDLAEYLAGVDEQEYADAVATLQHGRTPHPVRAAVVAPSAAAAAAALGRGGPEVVHGRVRADATTAFLFPGQGTQHAGMAAGLYGTVRPFSVAMDECLELFEEQGLRLDEVWLDGTGLDSPEVAQPLLFAVEYALAEMWRAWGVRPQAVLGHSLGELVAATIAGVFDLPDAVSLVAARGRAMAAHPFSGGMLAVAAPAEEITRLLPTDIAVASVNTAAQTVVSGPAQAIDDFAATLAADGRACRRLEVSHAFHHPGWAAAAERFAEAFGSVTVHEPTLPLYSGRTGRRIGSAEAKSPEFWAGQLTLPVQFGSALDTMLAEGPRILVEAGPGDTLVTFARRHTAVAEEDGLAVASLAGSGDDASRALGAAARLWTAGVPLDWEAADQPRPMSRKPVPGYPYHRERYWVDPVPESPVVPQPRHRPAAPADAEQHRAGTADVADLSGAVASFVVWEAGHEVDTAAPEAGGTALVLLPDDPEPALDVLLAVERAGYRTIRVRPGESAIETAGEFHVRLGAAEDLTAVIATLERRGIEPELLVHAAGTDPVAEFSSSRLQDGLDAACLSLMTLAGLAQRRPTGQAPELTVLTRGAVDVSGSDPLDPARATVLGLVRTLRDEAPALRARVIDVADRVSTARLAAELTQPDAPELVALRGHRRWTPTERSLPVPAPRREVLREGGVYLITGGFGGLGLALARHLAAAGVRPRLILMGRRDPMAPEAAADDPYVRRAREAVAELHALGAQVLTTAADVARPGALEDVVASVQERFGPVNGVFHLAGVAGDRMVAFRDPADAKAVLAPKTAGTALLAEAFANRPMLDFAVFFGSRAAVDGLVGGGDYAAANAFIDAAAQLAPIRAARVLNIAWPVWRGDGMADADGPDLSGLPDLISDLAAGTRPGPVAPPALVWEEEYGPAHNWVLDEHRIGRVPLLPGAAYVDLIVTLFTARLAQPDQATELTDVLFKAPFSDERPRKLRVVFTASGNGYAFTVSSTPAQQPDSAPVEHVTGRVAGITASADPVDVDGLRRRLTAAGTAHNRVAVDDAFTMGPRWRNITEVWQAGDEKLLRLALFPGFVGDLVEHRLHPALLDTATAGVRSSGEGAYVPFLYQRLVFHADLPAELYSHARRRPAQADTAVGDIDLIAPDGTLLARVEGFTMRRVEFREGWDRPPAERAPADLAGPRPGEVTPHRQGIDPEAGLRLLMALLASDTPPSVLVRPREAAAPATSRSVPTAEPTAEAADAAPLPTAPPVRPPEHLLAQLWEQTIGTAPGGDDDDFFDAGGNSLSAVELIGRIRTVFGVELGIGLLLEVRTYGGLKKLVHLEQGNRADA
ncbi:SDR family NAD(P)-dependent oxidoreductase [Streptomyces sp. NPDC007856]|uniref:type I polyketide synthase n=1 Tax=Streptomyces sp. NPDC007856 TaxID=3364781 RepID=UPI00368C9B24